MAGRIVLYQRLNKQGGYASVPVQYSRNGSPIANKNATRFYLRGRAEGKRFCIPAGENVLEADAQRKVMEARLATGAAIPMPAGMAVVPATPVTDRKVIATEAAAYIERSKSKKPKTYKGYRDAVDFFLSICKKTYLDELTRDDMIALKEALKEKYALQTVFSTWMKVSTFLNDCHITKLVNRDTWIQRKDRPVNVAKRNAKNKKYPVYSEEEFAAMLAVADKTELALLYFFVGCGWRNGEAAVAQWGDIDWDAKAVTVREKPEFNFTPKDYEICQYYLNEKRREIERESPYRLVSAALRTGTGPDTDLRPFLCGNLRRLACPLSTRRCGSVNQRPASHASHVPKDRNLWSVHD